MANTSTSIDFSIVLPAYNEEETITKTLAAACATYAREIIVVDDGSSDQTGALVRKVFSD